MTMHENSNRRSTQPDKTTISASDAVARAVTVRPGSTAAELAAVTGLGRSTVSKSLAALEVSGVARRELGGRDGARRLPDRWLSALDSHTTAVAGGKAPAAGSVTAGRLGKGELGAMVLEYLSTHPDDEVGPTVVARVLGRSQGAVANALTKLATSGHAELTSEAPRRYRRVEAA